MVHQQEMKFLSHIIHVMDAHSHASSIQIKRQSVGIQDVWVNVLHHVHHLVQHHVMADALIMILNQVHHIRLEKVKDVLQDVL